MSSNPGVPGVGVTILNGGIPVGPVNPVPVIIPNTVIAPTSIAGAGTAVIPIPGGMTTLRIFFSAFAADAAVTAIDHSPPAGTGFKNLLFNDGAGNCYRSIINGLYIAGSKTFYIDVAGLESIEIASTDSVTFSGSISAADFGEPVKSITLFPEDLGVTRGQNVPDGSVAALTSQYFPGATAVELLTKVTPVVGSVLTAIAYPIDSTNTSSFSGNLGLGVPFATTPAASASQSTNYFRFSDVAGQSMGVSGAAFGYNSVVTTAAGNQPALAGLGVALYLAAGGGFDFTLDDVIATFKFN